MQNEDVAGWQECQVRRGGLICGRLCAYIGRSAKPVIALAGAVLVVGLIMAYFTRQKPDPTEPRAPSMTVRQIIHVGRVPTWIAILNPITGVIMVSIGGVQIGAPSKPRRAIEMCNTLDQFLSSAGSSFQPPLSLQTRRNFGRKRAAVPSGASELVGAFGER